MKRRHVVVTGGTSGVGFVVARDAARRGHRVLIVGRDEVRGAETLETIRAHSSEADVAFERLDVTDFDATRELTQRLAVDRTDIDTLSYNAGIISLSRQTTPGGVERSLAVNYLGFYALTQLMIPTLLATDSPRITCVSGNPGLIERVSLDLDDLESKHGYFGPRAAIRAAVAKVLLTEELNTQFSDRKFSAVTYHPGLVHSGLGNSLPFPLRLGFKLINAFLPKSSPTASYVVDGDLDVHGGGIFWARGKPVSFEHRVHDTSDRTRLIELSAEITGIRPAYAS